jgi:hypothetical protein
LIPCYFGELRSLTDFVGEEISNNIPWVMGLN